MAETLSTELADAEESAVEKRYGRTGPHGRARGAPRRDRGCVRWRRDGSHSVGWPDGIHGLCGLGWFLAISITHALHKYATTYVIIQNHVNRHGRDINNFCILAPLAAHTL